MANNVNNSPDNNSNLSPVGSTNNTVNDHAQVQGVAVNALNRGQQQGETPPSLAGRVTKDPHYTWLDAFSYFCHWLGSGRNPISFEDACKSNNPAVVRGAIYYQKEKPSNEKAIEMINEAYENQRFEVIYAIVGAGYPIVLENGKGPSIVHQAMLKAYDPQMGINREYIEFIAKLANLVGTDLSEIEDEFGMDFFRYGVLQAPIMNEEGIKPLTHHEEKEMYALLREKDQDRLFESLTADQKIKVRRLLITEPRFNGALRLSAKDKTQMQAFVDSSEDIATRYKNLTRTEQCKLFAFLNQNNESLGNPVQVEKIIAVMQGYENFKKNLLGKIKYEFISCSIVEFNKINPGLFSKVFSDFLLKIDFKLINYYANSTFFDCLSLANRQELFNSAIARIDKIPGAVICVDVLRKKYSAQDFNNLISSLNESQKKQLFIQAVKSNNTELLDCIKSFGYFKADPAIIQAFQGATQDCILKALDFFDKLSELEAAVLIFSSLKFGKDVVQKVLSRKSEDQTEKEIINQAAIIVLEALSRKELSGAKALNYLQLLTELGLEVDQALTVAANIGNFPCLDFLEKSGGKIDQRDDEGNTLLHLMVKGNFDLNTNWIQSVHNGLIDKLKKFAEIPNTQGKTPIQIASDALKVEKDAERIQQLELFIRTFEPNKSIEDIIKAGDKDALIRKMTAIANGPKQDQILARELRAYLNLALKSGKDDLFVEMLNFVRDDVAFFAFNAKDDGGNNLLHEVCRQGKDQLIEAICKYKITNSLTTPLKDQRNSLGQKPEDIIKQTLIGENRIRFLNLLK